MLGDVIHLGAETSVFWGVDTEWDLLHSRRPNTNNLLWVLILRSCSSGVKAASREAAVVVEPSEGLSAVSRIVLRVTLMDR